MRIRTLLVTTLLTLLSACGVTPTAAPAGATTTTIKTGYIPVVIYAPLYIGIERGYFAEEGITVELTPITSGNDAVVQLAAGNFDVALGGANAGLFNAAARGVKFTIVAPLHHEQAPDASPLVISARRTGEFKSIADLRGKKVAVVAKGAALEYWLQEALKRGNLTINDVEVTAMPFADMPAALEQGAIDAALITEPGVALGRSKGLLAILSEDFINGFTPTYVYMSESLVQKPEAGAFMRAYLRACRDLQGAYMTPEVAAIIEKYTKIPAAALQQSNLARYDASGALPIADLQTLQSFYLERGYLTYQQPLDLTPFINTKLAAEAAR